MLPDDFISHFTVFSTLFASRWTEVKPFTTPNVHFFSTRYGVLASDPWAPGQQRKYNIEGCLWAGSVGFEAVLQHSTKHPSRETEYIRHHIRYDAWAGAPDRRATFESMNTMDQLRAIFTMLTVERQGWEVR